MNTWPDGGMTPFRSEKNTNWEGAFRVPELIRWPGKIPAGVVSNEIVQHHDWLPTFLAAAGEPDIVEKLKAGHTVGDKTFKVHIDGYNLLPYLTGEVDKSPRQASSTSPTTATCSRSGSTTGRSSSWSSACQGTLQIWAEPFVALRVPKLFNLRTDPFERADITSNTYYDWFLDNDYIVLAATVRHDAVPRDVPEFPPRQKAASFTIDQAVEKLEAVSDVGALSADVTDSPPGTTPPTRAAILDFVARVTRRAPRLRSARRADRGVRQRRHAVVREADADRARLHPAAVGGDGGGGSVAARPSSRGRPPTRRTTPGSAPP